MQAVNVDSQPKILSDGLYQLPFASGNSWTANLRVRDQPVSSPVQNSLDLSKVKLLGESMKEKKES